MDDIINKIIEKKNFKDIPISDFAPADKWSDMIAKQLGDKMKTTQLRKFFTEIKLMEQKNKGKDLNAPFSDPKLFMLIPHLAYAKARKLIIPKFYDLMKTIIGDGNSGKIKTIGDYQRFVEFMTAIVAYHKQYSK